MRIEKPILKIGSRVRLTHDYEMSDCIYTKSHMFIIVAQTARGWDLKDDSGYCINEVNFNARYNPEDKLWDITMITPKKLLHG